MTEPSSTAEAKRKMADMLEAAVREWATDMAPWVRVGLLTHGQAEDLLSHPELKAHFLAEMKQLAARLRAEAR